MTALVMGTRGSRLARAQSGQVARALEVAHPGLAVRAEIIRTRGDRILDRPLAAIGGKGLFIKEIEEALLDGRIDLAVHSLKDMPAEPTPGLALAALPERGDPRDVVVWAEGVEPALRPGLRVGTGSLRRAAQLRALSPGVVVRPLRGNVDTRLRRLEGGAEPLDAVVLAAAGLARLGLLGGPSSQPDRVVLDDGGGWLVSPLACDDVVPAVGQGTLVIQVRSDDERALDLVAALHHEPTAAATTAERAFLAAVAGSCHIPVGAWARSEGADLVCDAVIARPDGGERLRARRAGPPASAATLGEALATELLDRGGRDILDACAAAAEAEP